MSLTIDRTIDLTAASGNPSPKLVSQLSIIHESSDGELVQYYINPDTQLQGDKNTYAIGVYDKDSRSYSYTEYQNVQWDAPKQRIGAARIDRLGVKAFPGMGAFAFYKLSHRKITRIVIPVNRESQAKGTPTLAATENADGTVTFRITQPEELEYECFRIIMEYDIYAEEWITYDLEFTAPKPKITGQYRCYAIGYGEEGQLYSNPSNLIVLNLRGKNERFINPYYTTDDINNIVHRMDDLEAKLNEHKIEKDVPADAQFTDTIYDDTQIRGQVQANTNNVDLLMDAMFNQNIFWLVDSGGYQIIDSNGYPIYTPEYASRIEDLQGRKFLYWGEAQN